MNNELLARVNEGIDEINKIKGTQERIYNLVAAINAVKDVDLHDKDKVLARWIRLLDKELGED